MHDIVNLEARGIPTVAVVTEQFETGANAQGKALGFDPAIIFVEHPIQDRTDTELQQLANAVCRQLVDALTNNG